MYSSYDKYGTLDNYSSLMNPFLSTNKNHYSYHNVSPYSDTNTNHKKMSSVGTHNTNSLFYENLTSSQIQSFPRIHSSHIPASFSSSNNPFVQLSMSSQSNIIPSVEYHTKYDNYNNTLDTKKLTESDETKLESYTEESISTLDTVDPLSDINEPFLPELDSTVSPLYTINHKETQPLFDQPISTIIEDLLKYASNEQIIDTTIASPSIDQVEKYQDNPSTEEPAPTFTPADVECNSKHIPFVIIAYNNLTFVKNFINQLRRFPNPIWVIDNKSTYQALHDYYKELETEMGNHIKIHRMEANYGHNVYKTHGYFLPHMFMLSDPDLELNPLMPLNASDILLELSNQYKAYKVGTALDLSDSNKFVPCEKYSYGKNIANFESQFWTRKINHPMYELYESPIDTTFCLVNNNYHGGICIRMAGIFTAKHLPWYNDYVKLNVPQDEIDHWKQENKSSSILFTCLKL